MAENSDPRNRRPRGPPTQTGPHKPHGVRSIPFIQSSELSMALTGEYAMHTLAVTYTNDPDEAKRFCERYFDGLHCRHMGFDLEHRPQYAPGSKANVSLLQFAPFFDLDARVHAVLIFSIYHNQARLPQCLVDVLASPIIRKHGVGIAGDLRHLAYLELPAHARSTFCEVERDVDQIQPDLPGKRSLKALTETLLDPACITYKTKRITMSDWEDRHLSNAQILYAAMDALCGVMLWAKLEEHQAKYAILC